MGYEVIVWLYTCIAVPVLHRNTQASGLQSKIHTSICLFVQWLKMSDTKSWAYEGLTTGIYIYIYINSILGFEQLNLYRFIWLTDGSMLDPLTISSTINLCPHNTTLNLCYTRFYLLVHFEK